MVLLSGMNLFGDEPDCVIPDRTLTPQMPKTAAYNAPSYIEARWDVFFTGNFTYWSASQENLELGLISDVPSGSFSFNGAMVEQNFDFAPGFQFGVGTNTGYDNWDFYSQYTWFRNTDTVTTSLDTTSTQRLYPMWGKPNGTSARYFYGQEKWKLSMDFVDIELGRSCYAGTALTLRPSLGLRGAFIRQYLNTSYLNEASSLIAHNVYIAQKSHSWGVGPKASLYSSWMLGQGVRLYGNGSTDILFTRYTTVNTHQKSTNTAGSVIAGGITDVNETDVDYVRTHLDLEIGFGWGTYFYANQYHFDISAGYDFQVFFNQNMFRGFSDDASFNSSLPHGDLFVQGLTVSARFDF